MSHDLELKPAEFKLFQTFMYDCAGINLNDKKQLLVRNRLRQRLEILHLHSYRDYYDYLMAPQHLPERQAAINALTTNETFFFRHKNHWDFIIETLIPQWQKTATPMSVFHAWSGASSTGEEAYSLAIVLAHLFNATTWQTEIDATDINQEVLNAARQGIYHEYALQKTTTNCVKMYFEKNGTDYRVKPPIRRSVKFQLHNLMQPFNAKISYDLIMLRNVLIYFDDSSKKIVMENVTAKLKPNGYLFVGGSETMTAGNNAYECIRPTIYRKK